MDQDAIQSFLCWRTQTFRIYAAQRWCSFATVDVFIARRVFTLKWLLTQTNKKMLPLVKKKECFANLFSLYHISEKEPIENVWEEGGLERDWTGHQSITLKADQSDSFAAS